MTVYFRQEHVHTSGRNLSHATDANRLALGVTILADTVQAPLDPDTSVERRTV